MNWLQTYLDCTRDRLHETLGDAALQRDDDFRNHVYRRADGLGFPRCRFRPAEAVCAGAEAWALFTSRADVHALADSMLSLDELEYMRWRG